MTAAAAAPFVAGLEVRRQAELRPVTAWEFWLLAVFSAGMVALLLGLSVALAGRLRWRPPDPAEEEASRRLPVGGWLLVTGAFLLILYGMAWTLAGIP